MTVNKFTRTLKDKGYEMVARYSLWKSDIIFHETIFTEYAKDGKVVIATKRVKGTKETTVSLINRKFEEEFKEMGIYLGTILK